MSVETLERPSNASQEASSDSQAKSILMQANEVRDRMSVHINSGLNQEVGARNQADAAHDVVTLAQQANSAAALAPRLESYQAGEINDDDVDDELLQAIIDDETPATLMAKAAQFEQEVIDLKAEQEKPMEYDVALKDARQNYIKLLMDKPLLKGRKAYKEEFKLAEETYNDALVGKIATILDLDPSHKKAPYAPPVGHELSNEKPTFQELSGNQLHVLVDQLALEMHYKTKEMDKNSNKTAKRVLRKFQQSRALRYIVGGTIAGGAVLAASKGLLPEHSIPVDMESSVDVASLVLPSLTGSVAALETFVKGDKFMTKERRAKRLRRDIDEISESTFLTDVALRSVYTNVEYLDGTLPNRSGGDTVEDNKAAFEKIDDVYEQLAAEGYRGGRPYGSETVLPYVAELYLRRKGQIDAVVASQDPKAAFLQLSREVIEADTRELAGRRRKDRGKQAAFKVSALLVGAAAGPFAEAAKQTREAANLPMAAAAIGAH
jgi:hypothetical protein